MINHTMHQKMINQEISEGRIEVTLLIDSKTWAFLLIIQLKDRLERECIQPGRPRLFLNGIQMSLKQPIHSWNKKLDLRVNCTEVLLYY